MCITSLSWFISSYHGQQSSFSSDHQEYSTTIFNPPQGSRSLRLEIVPVQQQDGVHDCGLFAIAYGTEECLGRRPEPANFEQALMRQHLIKCLQKESFDPFPRASLPSILPQLNSVFKLIKLYCICHMPDHFDETSFLTQSDIKTKKNGCS